MANIGFSTGALARGDFMRALQLLEKTHTNAVELSALRNREMPEMMSKLPSLRAQLEKRYQYISFHAPTDFVDESELVQQLSKIADFGWSIIVHPDTIGQICLWKSLGQFLCIENMDSRKHTGRTVGELLSFFDVLQDAKLCFDIAHARQIDPTMTEAKCIIDTFGDRLEQIHLSEVDGRGRHFSMSFTARLAYEPFAEVMSKVPVILESIVSENEIESEVDVANSIINNKKSLSARGYSFIPSNSKPLLAAGE